MFNFGVTSTDVQKARQTAKRNRTSIACSRCKAAKMKCSDYRPCKQCTNASISCKEANVRPSPQAEMYVSKLSERSPESEGHIFDYAHHSLHMVGGSQQDFDANKTLAPLSYSVQCTNKVTVLPFHNIGKDRTLNYNETNRPSFNIRQNPLLIATASESMCQQDYLCRPIHLHAASGNSRLLPPIKDAESILSFTPPAVLPPVAAILHAAALPEQLQPDVVRPLHTLH